MIKICINCGKEFETNSRKRKMCSKECIKEHKSRIMIEKCKDTNFINNRNIPQ